MPAKAPRVEEFQVTGEKLLAMVKKLAHEGNIRRISIRTSRGVTLLEIPLVVGVAGAVFLPVWAAVGALAALLADGSIVVERIEEGAKPAPTKKAPRKPKRAA